MRKIQILTKKDSWKGYEQVHQFIDIVKDSNFNYHKVSYLYLENNVQHTCHSNHKIRTK